MIDSHVTDEDRKKAQVCLTCPVCKKARRDQKGIAYWFVKNVEGSVCPACQAYEKVYGRKAHESLG